MPVIDNQGQVKQAGVAGGGFSQTIGDGSSTAFTVSHGLGTDKVIVVVRETAAPFRAVLAEWSVLTTNTVGLAFDAAPTLGQYVVTILSSGDAAAKPGANVYQALVGNGVGTSFTVTHGFGTRALVVSVVDATTFAEVNADVAYTTVNEVTVGFAAAPPTNGYQVTVIAGAAASVSSPSPHAATHLPGSSDALSSALATRPVLDVGVLGQSRAGRQLTLGDFTTLGLSAPLGLWNLSDASDASGNGRALTNKGSVAFGKGILGLSPEAAIFVGSTAQALYIDDAPWQQIKTGSWFCWMRTAKRGVNQDPFSKAAVNIPAASSSYAISTRTDNTARAMASIGGTLYESGGVTDIADDRLHFVVCTYDGSVLRLYVDGSLESSLTVSGTLNASSAPLNIGGRGANAGTATDNPFAGRVDEAGLLADVLNEEQIRLLMAQRIPHGLTVTPREVRVSTRRQKRGGVLATSDFATPTGVKRIFNWNPNPSALADTSGNVALTDWPSVVAVAGPDGTSARAFHSQGVDYARGPDTGLPTGARSLLCWVKLAPAAGGVLLGYGTSGSNQAWMLGISGGAFYATTQESAVTSGGPDVRDGSWHLGIVTYDPAATDAVYVKVYTDGKLTATATSLWTPVLAGATGLRVGSDVVGTTVGATYGPVAITNYALAAEEIASLWAKGSSVVGSSLVIPDLGSADLRQCVQGMDATNVYWLGDIDKKISGRVNAAGNPEHPSDDFRVTGTNPRTIYFPPGTFSRAPTFTASYMDDSNTTRWSVQSFRNGAWSVAVYTDFGGSGALPFSFTAEGRGPIPSQHQLDLGASA